MKPPRLPSLWRGTVPKRRTWLICEGPRPSSSLGPSSMRMSRRGASRSLADAMRRLAGRDVGCKPVRAAGTDDSLWRCVGGASRRGSYACGSGGWCAGHGSAACCSRASCASTNGGNARTVCRCAGSSCPTGYVQSGSCSTTTATTCTGDTDGCGRSVYDTRCRTTSHSFADAPREICRYEHRDRNLFSCRHQTRICQARVTHVGCVSSSSTTPGPFDPGPGDPGPGDPGPGGFSDDGDWSEPARGYLLPTSSSSCRSRADHSARSGIASAE